MAQKKISQLTNLPEPQDADLIAVVDVSETETKQTTFLQFKDRLKAVLGLSASDISDFDTEVSNNADVVANTAKRSYPSADETKLAGIEAGADVTDAANVDAAGATMNTDTDVSGNSWVLDEDDMTSNSATKVPTQQSVKAYVDANAGTSGYATGTAYVDSSNFHNGTTSISGGGTISVTGLGFNPTRLRVRCFGAGSETFSSEGHYDGTTYTTLYYDRNTNNFSNVTNVILRIDDTAGDEFSATVTFQTGGFDLVFSELNSMVGAFGYVWEAFEE